MATKEKKNETPVKVKLIDLYTKWANKGDLHPDIKLMLGFNLPDAPEIKESTLMCMMNLTPVALYLAYLETWGEQKLKDYRFHSPAVGEDVIAVEEDICQNYALLRKDGNGGYELTGGFSDPPVLAIKLLIEAIAPQELVENLKRSMAELSRHWKEVDSNGSFINKDSWKVTASPANTNLLGLSIAIDGLFQKDGPLADIEIDYWKAKTPDDVMLDIGCEKTFGMLQNPISENIFHAADARVAERVLKLPPKADFKTAMSAIKLIPDEMLFDDVKYMVPSLSEPRYKNGYSLAPWEVELIRGVACGTVRNAMLYGPAGTGKTTSVRTLALALGLPCYPPMVCSSETRKEDLIGSFYVNKEQKLVYSPSALMQAVRYGGVVELQEPSCIRDPGTLTVLNNVFDPCGFIQIPETGEFFPRHKHCVIVLTTNQDYAGCRPINASVLSRMEFTKYVDGLTEDELVRRASSEPNVVMDEEYLRLMAKCYARLCEICVEESLYGDSSYRTFLSWVSNTCLCGSAVTAAEFTIINKMSFSSEQDAKLKLRSTIEAMLQNKKPTIAKDKQANTFKKELDAIATLVDGPKKKEF